MMLQLARAIVVIPIVVCLPAPFAMGQFGGSRAGQEAYVAGVANLPILEPAVAEAYITIEGRAEVRVAPTEIRVVMALTSEGETARQCQASIRDTADRAKAAWSALGIAGNAIVEDFIAVLPQYEWTLEKRGDVDVATEQRTGYRMQTNLHLAASDQAQALVAMNLAFEEGVTDIIAFDYWSQELDETQRDVREQALSAARSKADALLGPLFDDRPPIINVQEQTSIRYPESLYHSFTNSYEEAVAPAPRRDVPLIRAARPQNTYYRGLFSAGDVLPPNLPMKPEISVVSTVRLYFQSPAARQEKASSDQRLPSGDD